jgi:hypothetical protein
MAPKSPAAALDLSRRQYANLRDGTRLPKGAFTALVRLAVLGTLKHRPATPSPDDWVQVATRVAALLRFMSPGDVEVHLKRESEALTK